MSARYSMRRSDHMEYSLWLAFDEQGGVTLSRGKPSLSPRQRGMALTIRVPLMMFKTPELTATITIAPPNVEPITVDIDAATRALESVIGCQVVVHVQEPSS